MQLSRQSVTLTKITQTRDLDSFYGMRMAVTMIVLLSMGT